MDTIKLSMLTTDPRSWVSNNASFVLRRSGDMDVPIVGNLHTKILDQIENGKGRLNMDNWHGDSDQDEYSNEGFCQTTHCYCGWAEVYAGKEWFDKALIFSHTAIGHILIGASFPEMEEEPDFSASHDEALENITHWAAFEKANSSGKE